MKILKGGVDFLSSTVVYIDSALILVFYALSTQKKTLCEHLQMEARAGYQANFTKWILINCICVSIMVVMVMIVMELLVIPLMRWCCEGFQRRFPVRHHDEWLR